MSVASLVHGRNKEEASNLKTLYRAIAVSALGIFAGSSVATPEKAAVDFFPKPYVSVFEQLDKRDQKPMQLAVTCFGSGERTSGMNKICYYDCLGSTAAITISSVELCPLTINQ